MNIYNNILLNIPHSSVYIPKGIFKDENEKFFLENKLKQTDLYTDIIFKQNKELTNKVQSFIFPYNRLYCDIERYWDDNKEIMSKIGQGAYYTNYLNGDTLFRYDKKDDIKFIFNFYQNLIKEIVTPNINNKTKGLIIDCHSFNDNIVNDSPDICIGINSDNSSPNKKLINDIASHFEEHKLIVNYNYPYEGSYYPFKYPNEYVKTIMIEINKKLYLDDSFNIKQYESENLNKILNDLYNKLLK